jgi:hypothetical protein
VLSKSVGLGRDFIYILGGVRKVFSVIVVKVTDSGHLVLLTDGTRLYVWQADA